MRTRVARWSYESERYELVLGGHLIYSRDGDWWRKEGRPEMSREFARIRIKFRGGPRDGEIVS